MRLRQTYHLLPNAKFQDFQLPKPTLAHRQASHEEWFRACRGGEPATCNFDYSGPMAETVLLANIAYRIQGSFEWDAAKLQPKGNAEAEKSSHGVPQGMENQELRRQASTIQPTGFDRWKPASRIK